MPSVAASPVGEWRRYLAQAGKHPPAAGGFDVPYELINWMRFPPRRRRLGNRDDEYPFIWRRGLG